MKQRHPVYAVGIDFGGTAVKLALVSGGGRILAGTAFPTAQASTPGPWIRMVADHVAALRARAGLVRRPPAGIGVGVPGFVDFKRGFIYELSNVPGWRSVNLARRLAQRFRMPARVDNDVNAMAVGECACGAGRRFRHAVFATLGTGVGGALLIDGRLYRGAFSMAGEIGHVPIERRGRPSPQGQGGLELYVGNRPLVARALRALRGGRRSRIRDLAHGDLGAVTPKVIAAAARAGDPLAREVFDYMAECLATAFAGVTYLLQPEVFIVGGGVAASGRVLFAPLRRHLRARLSPFFARRIRVIPAQLGNDAGVIGAATLALARGA